MGRQSVDNGIEWEKRSISRFLKRATACSNLRELQNDNKRGSKSMLPVHSGTAAPAVFCVSFFVAAILRRI